MSNNVRFTTSGLFPNFFLQSENSITRDEPKYNQRSRIVQPEWKSINIAHLRSNLLSDNSTAMFGLQLVLVSLHKLFTISVE